VRFTLPFFEGFLVLGFLEYFVSSNGVTSNNYLSVSQSRLMVKDAPEFSKGL